MSRKDLDLNLLKRLEEHMQLKKFQMEKKILLSQQQQQVTMVDQLHGDHKDWV